VDITSFDIAEITRAASHYSNVWLSSQCCAHARHVSPASDQYWRVGETARASSRPCKRATARRPSAVGRRPSAVRLVPRAPAPLSSDRPLQLTDEHLIDSSSTTQARSLPFRLRTPLPKSASSFSLPAGLFLRPSPDPRQHWRQPHAPSSARACHQVMAASPTQARGARGPCSRRPCGCERSPSRGRAPSPSRRSTARCPWGRPC